MDDVISEPNGPTRVDYPEYDCLHELPRHPTETLNETAHVIAGFYKQAMSERGMYRTLWLFTLHEVVFRTVSNLVRNKQVPGLKVIFVWIDKDGEKTYLDTDDKGEPIAPWPDMMFETSYHLIFGGLPDLPAETVQMLIDGRDVQNLGGHHDVDEELKEEDLHG
jgi:hypothetical protein